MDLTTGLSSYKTFHTIADINVTQDNDLLAGSTLGVGKPSGSVDLQILDSAGKHLKVNSFSIIVHATSATNGDDFTEKIYGAAEQGPPQLIASIQWTLGLARVDGSEATYLWADQAVVTSTHMRTITVADGAGGDNRICSVTFDLTGYRYVLGKWTADSGDPDAVTALYRSF